MKRKQIYITDEQDRRIAALAKDGKTSAAEVIRRILDAALETGTSDREAAARAAIVATAGVCADYPAWEEWQRSVRGRSADERLRAGGL